MLFKDINNIYYIMEGIYNNFLKQGLSQYYSKEDFVKCYGRVPRQRDYTFNYCLNHLKKKNNINILELGTSRSFVDGKYMGACSTDPIYWNPKSIEKWDWSAGLFTKYFSDLLTENKKEFRLTTVDIDKDSIDICKIITNKHPNINYMVNSSENSILNCPLKVLDLLYLDTGNLDEETAKLHLREAKLLVKRDILKDDGLILIDDVRNPWMLLNNKTTDKLGKSKYALPYLLNNGFELVEDEYQVILKKKKIKL